MPHQRPQRSRQPALRWRAAGAGTLGQDKGKGKDRATGWGACTSAARASGLAGIHAEAALAGAVLKTTNHAERAVWRDRARAAIASGGVARAGLLTLPRRAFKACTKVCGFFWGGARSFGCPIQVHGC